MKGTVWYLVVRGESAARDPSTCQKGLNQLPEPVHVHRLHVSFLLLVVLQTLSTRMFGMSRVGQSQPL